MLGFLKGWVGRRRALSRLRQQDARELLACNPETAFYDAQRIAARARFTGDRSSFFHWAAVASEVARISDNPMDIKVVQAIVDEEERRASFRPR